MPYTPKVLGQFSITAPSTLYDVYTVPALTRATISTIVVANRTGASVTFRVSIAVAGAADDVKQYLYYDIPIPANDTFAATIGATVGPADVVRCYGSSTGISVNLFGIEET
jgi:hypothetical protein